LKFVITVQVATEGKEHINSTQQLHRKKFTTKYFRRSTVLIWSMDAKKKFIYQLKSPEQLISSVFGSV